MKSTLRVCLSLLLMSITWMSAACPGKKVILGQQGVQTHVNQADFVLPNRTYVIRGICDLSGRTVTIPEQSILDVRRGELKGGTIVLAEGVSIKDGRTKNLNVFTKGFFANKTVYVENKSYASSHLQSVASNIELQCDIDLAAKASGLSLYSNLNGNGHYIRIAGPSYDLIYVKKEGITIKNVVLENKPTNPKSDCRVILGSVGGVTLMNSTLRGAIVFAPGNGIHEPLRDITIKDCFIDCDFSSLMQGYAYQHDVLTFRACKGVVIYGNTIHAKDVNRVLKTARGWAVDGDSDNSRTLSCVEDIVIEKNNIVSEASCGKQFWDMYNGTVNARFINNTVSCLGHTVVFENKTKDDLGSKSITIIEGNTIETDWKLFFLNSNKDNDSYIIRNNRVLVSGDEREHTDLAGQKKNRNYVNSMAGFASVLFENNTLTGTQAGEGLYPFVFQLQSGDVSIHKNVFNNLGPILVVESAEMNTVDVAGNDYRAVSNNDYEMNIAGRVSRIRYVNKLGTSKTAIRMTKESYEMSRDIEIDAPGSETQLKIKQGPAFEKGRGISYKKEGEIIKKK